MKNHIAKSELITITDELHCYWSYTYFRRRGWLMAEPEGQPKDVNMEQQIERLAQLVVASLEQLEYFRHIPPNIQNNKRAKVAEMSESYKNSKLSAIDLRLLRGVNDRIINAFWIEVKNISEKNPDNGKLQYLYSEMPLEPNPSNSSKRRENLISFFNFLEWPRLEKLKVLDRLQLLAKTIQTFEKSFRWLDSKKEGQCDWAYMYVRKRLAIESHIDPISSEEKYFSTIAIFDCWPALIDSKKLFLLDIRRAWSQKKHREKLEGKKPYNFIMNKGLAKKLDVLSKKLDLSKNEIVEKIIESEFFKHFPKT